MTEQELQTRVALLEQAQREDRTRLIDVETSLSGLDSDFAVHRNDKNHMDMQFAEVKKGLSDLQKSLRGYAISMLLSILGIIGTALLMWMLNGGLAIGP